MSQIYDNWDRLVRSTLRREQLRLIALRTPSLSPSASSSSSPRSSPLTISSSPPSLNKILNLLIGEACDYRRILKASNYFSYSSDCSLSLEVLLNDGLNYVYKYTSYNPLDYSSSSPMDWISVLKIAVGTAKALCYLHHEFSPPLVHRDIQASSIFLDDNYQVRLGSLSYVCAQEEEKKAKKQNKISSVQGTSGKPATCAYDVYCFGKVLLELITGKLGISASCDAATDQDWLQKLQPHIDLYDDERVENIDEPFLIVDELFSVTTAMAIVARCCMNPDSSMRPLMKNVLTALENPLIFFQ